MDFSGTPIGQGHNAQDNQIDINGSRLHGNFQNSTESHHTLRNNTPVNYSSFNNGNLDEIVFPKSENDVSRQKIVVRGNQPTLGQLAEQVQAKARASAIARGEGQIEDEEKYSSGEEENGTELCTPGQELTGRWTRKEHELFLEALKKYGKEWKKVAAMVKTRTVVQTRTHAQKFFQKLTKGGSNGGSAMMGIDIDSFDLSTLTPSMSDSTTKRTSGNTNTASSKRSRRTESGNKATSAAISSPLNQYIQNQLEMELSQGAGMTPLSIAVPRSMNSGEFPQPSPAACGRRKHTELAVAEALAASASQDMEGVKLLSAFRGKANDRTPLSLSLTNPDSLPRLKHDLGEEPSTPWEADIRSLKSAIPFPSFESESMLSYSEISQSLQSIFEIGNSNELEDYLQTLRRRIMVAEANREIEACVFANVSDQPLSTELRESESHSLTPTSTSTAHSTAPTSSTSTSLPTLDSILSRVLNFHSSNRGNSLLEAMRIVSDANKALSFARILLDHGAAVNDTDAEGNTALHIACERDLDRVAAFLLSRGAVINAINRKGDTCCHRAAAKGCVEALKQLMSFGANCHIRNAQSQCALDLAGSELKDLDSNVRQSLRDIMLRNESRLRTLILFHEDCLQHNRQRPNDWESADRLVEIMGRLQSGKEFHECDLEFSSNFEKASVELLTKVHSAEYIRFVDDLSRQLHRGDPVPFTPQVQKFLYHKNAEELKKDELCDTSFSAGTLRAARRAAGAVAHAVDRVLSGRNRNAFCVVRPPGHHAGFQGLLSGAKSCGFCIFNSIAAGALRALDTPQCERVAIIDLDIHHGNGTEDIVRRYPNPSRLFFFSVHLFDKDEGYEFFPGSGVADDMVHNVINVPILPIWHDQSHNMHTTRSASQSQSQKLPKTAISGRDAYRQAIQQRLLPSLRAFNPDLILISAGFDAAQGDIGNQKSNSVGVDCGMDLREEDFEWVTTEIMKIADICCNGKVVSVLEGGYGSSETRNRSQKKTGAFFDGNTYTVHGNLINRSLLASNAIAHIRRLVDPYDPFRADENAENNA